ncbi:MAG: hypothetical protein F6K18_28250 [Okeania sp. SIO2C2]|uniref:hypothetical protein n=1 Tax=unclassified Okeania TaxID=2634635 RepID=UPI0013B6659F|nr:MULTISPECIES: hypothetical protein [unclassified Okeania]NEP43760.1 hypothetical protein [Okeania sp. SIO2H7]NEP71968.1 hypothetical protein [Okeania sp. SIO2G5]NEP90405.1 hypothetical protein [Okeania sp. SIO2C2]NEP95188.1 hypothetical protein [Okeania sp. SIO2F5]NEQ91120.1 hypothetical protein [Okeania sp. SIO2G4]
MFQFIYFVIHAIQPFLVPLCFVFAWGLIILTFWSIIGALLDSVRRAKQMHEIPCANCLFFTGDYHLKCPVQPKVALSEKAINCIDYRPKSVSWYDRINSY